MPRDKQSEASAFELGSIALQELLLALKLITHTARALLDAQAEGVPVPEHMAQRFRA